MKAGGLLLLLLLSVALLALGGHCMPSLDAKEAEGKDSKDGYCYNVPPVANIFEERNCSACLQNKSCSTCDNDSQCPGTQKCCPGDCGYVCQEAVIDFCRLPSVCGNCKAMFARYFYNASTQKCEQFVYGGCGGNKNNFDTVDDCIRTCGKSRTA
ncbi:actinia tenebrosa protease inhibitors-like [Podarcis raffonei]|uniref:actinia tenebrosa protease inhibitors-like n=1 Tax=Podarcis raffonei TaxID=65483 RepID=UPI00232932A6|nr:actinia tenebrosa protease inhibitors-like [Podarcis raffonei]